MGERAGSGRPAATGSQRSGAAAAERSGAAAADLPGTRELPDLAGSPPLGRPGATPLPGGSDERAAALSEAALAGDRRALARLLTAVENRSPVAEAALRRLFPLAGRAHLVGVTGAPGAGKSTLVAALIAEARSAGRSVAVVAVDPSSPITGGALLGDRVRMQAFAADDGVFIRSMASRGHAGGLAATSAAAAAVFDAVGFDLVFMETVGTGQSEVEVAAAADTTVVLETPEMGDEVQAIKAGLLEVADLVVVNKGDRPGAQRTAAQLRAMLSGVAAPRHVDLSRPGEASRAGDATRAADASEPGDATRPHPKRPEVLLTTATTGEGIGELLAALGRHRADADANGDGATVRLARAAMMVWTLVGERLRDALTTGDYAASTADLVAAVAAHDLDPYTAADRLLAALNRGGES